MGKTKGINYLEVVDTLFSTIKKKGIMYINSTENSFDGKYFEVNGRKLKNFATCGYLGLESRDELKEKAIELIKKYGTQFSMSRSYIRPIYIQELEYLLSQIFQGNKVLSYTATSTVHISMISTLIKPDDLIILDQQVHFSVQFACKHTRLQGTSVKMVKHSSYEMLDKMIVEDANKYQKIWYMADGVYSMYGDLPDTKKLQNLLNKHPKLHLYFDDAHGMGWSGKNGAGFIFDRLGVSSRIIITSTLAKGFGCVGGTAIFSDEEMYQKVAIFGGPLSYSHPLSPGNVGAAIASAKILLSNEINYLQQELRELMSHMNMRLREKNLPNVSSPNSPIYYIGGGLHKVTLNLVHRILNEGIYVNIAAFPAVPNDKSGLRFTITRHSTKEDLDELADVIAHHLPLAVKEENDEMDRMYAKFGFKYQVSDTEENLIENSSGLIIEEYNTIDNVDQKTWDQALKDRGNISHYAMQCMEEIFSRNELLEDNWFFHYILIKDKTGNLICATFFTSAIYKDDMLALEEVSKKIEEVRKENPYYLCSRTLTMGSMFAEGNFLYLDIKNPQWETAILELFHFAEKIKIEVGAKVIILRDFCKYNILDDMIEAESYVKIRMPNSNKINNPQWKKKKDFFKLANLRRKRLNVKKYVFKNEDQFKIKIRNEIDEATANQYFKLFENLKDSNFTFNFFKYPSKITQVLSKYRDWEFIEIKQQEGGEPIACIWCHIGESHYSPMVLGIGPDFLHISRIYKQAAYQVVKRASELNKDWVYLSFPVDCEEQGYEVISHETYAYIKMDDTYNFELIESYSGI